MYDPSDPRSKLAPAASPKPKTGLIAEEQLATYYDSPPQIEDADGQTWLLRSHNAVVAYSQVNPGGCLARQDQPDEYAIILPQGGGTLIAGSERKVLPGHSIAFVPPGDSQLTLPEGGVVIRLFTVAATNLVAACPNADAYATPRSHIPDFVPWPMPADGFKIRHYSLDVPPQQGRFGRIYRCTTFMVNMIYPYDGPRDPSKISPHHHDDFEQCSLLLEGRYSHYLRWPWTTDMADWKPDQEIKVDGPSVLVIPPPTIHTSRATGEGRNQLIDIFCPPRMDFSAREGWVLNAEDYPIPE